MTEENIPEHKPEPRIEEFFVEGNPFELAIPSNPALINMVANHFSQLLNAEPWVQDEENADRVQLEIAFREILTNALIHGNLEFQASANTNDSPLDIVVREGRTSNRLVYVSIAITSSEVSFTIQDQGKNTLDPATIPDPRRDENLQKTHGRGIFIAGMGADELSFSPTDEDKRHDVAETGTKAVFRIRNKRSKAQRE